MENLFVQKTVKITVDFFFINFK